MLFKAPKKQENTKIAEEIKITNVRNFYNDSLENDPEYNEEEEEEVEEKKEEKENNENKEKNVNIEEIIKEMITMLNYQMIKHPFVILFISKAKTSTFHARKQ